MEKDKKEDNLDSYLHGRIEIKKFSQDTISMCTVTFLLIRQFHWRACRICLSCCDTKAPGSTLKFGALSRSHNLLVCFRFITQMEYRKTSYL